MKVTPGLVARFAALAALALAAVSGPAATVRAAPPTDITLAPAAVAENMTDYPSLVGTFTTMDPDVEDFHYYDLVSGAGDADNGYFFIMYDQLFRYPFDLYMDYEAKSTYSLRVRSMDSNEATVEKVFQIAVVNVTRDDLYVTARNRPLVVGASGVLANDRFPGGDPLLVDRYEMRSDSGTVAGNPGGSFTYTPEPGFVGGDAFAYWACRTNVEIGPYECSRALAWITVANLFEDCEDGSADGFVTDGSGAWQVAAISPATAAHGARVYRMRAGGPWRVFMSRTRTAYGDFTFAADVRLAGGGSDSPARGMGLVFRSGKDYRNGYVFHVNARGFYNIFKRVGGVSRQLGGLPVLWRSSPAIRRGTGKWNRLEVVCSGASITFKINGVRVKTLRDSSFPVGYAGLKAFGDGANADRVEFDNIMVAGPRITFPPDLRAIVPPPQGNPPPPGVGGEGDSR